ncbi:DUF4959 domain-containing protein [Niabella insulamsoli]|uniref:DUF4959 domain-containing protein n=1 Tax=Niabella insulamsoli TaxID=3144874 RepID=UPI0031FDF9FA
MRTSIIFIIISTLFLLQACKQDLGYKEPSINDGVKPAPVYDVSVRNLPGKAALTYALPADKNLLYVKAVYKMSNGKEAETKSSYYSNSLTVEGFADTLSHEVKLYSVSRGEISSDPVTVTIKPLEAPIFTVLKNVKIVNAFGGYNLATINPDTSDIALLILKKNDFNEYEVDNKRSIYTNQNTISAQIRGLDTVASTVRYFIRDRWGNTTDTAVAAVKPLFEQEIPPTTFKDFTMPGDGVQALNGLTHVYYMWDNRYNYPFISFTNQAASGPGPNIVTFDMGVSAKLSRIWIRPYPEGSRWYYLTTMKRFEFWGSEQPNPNGALDDTWHLLGSYEVIKPSGLPYGTDNALDVATASAGFNWEIDINAPKVRYIRIRCLENFAGGTAQSVAELKPYGDLR